MFVENVGQFDAAVRFQVRWGDTVINLADDAICFSVSEAGQQLGLKQSFPGANFAPRLEPFDRLDTRVSFFMDNDPDRAAQPASFWGARTGTFSAGRRAAMATTSAPFKCR